MSEQMRAEFKKLFDEFAAKKIETAPDEWYTMSYEEIFIAGCMASRQALVVELPSSFCAEIYDVYEASDVRVALDKAGVSYNV